MLDTSVFVAALLGSGGASRQVVRFCLQKRAEPLMGAALFAEYESLLHRPALLERSPLSAQGRKVVFNALMSVCTWTRIFYRWRPNLPDEADNHVVELAVAGGASVIVTKNVRDFRSSELHFPGLRIRDPVDFLPLIR